MSSHPPLPRVRIQSPRVPGKYKPKPRAGSSDNLLVGIFESRARVAVLRILFGPKASELCIAAIADQSGMATQGVDEQLRRLAAMGLLLSRVDRSRRYYRADTKHPAFPSLQALVTISEKPHDPLQP